MRSVRSVCIVGAYGDCRGIGFTWEVVVVVLIVCGYLGYSVDIGGGRLLVETSREGWCGQTIGEGGRVKDVVL